MVPAALRTAGLVRTQRDLGHAVEDRGGLRARGPCRPARPPAGGGGWAKALSAEVEAALAAGTVRWRRRRPQPVARLRRRLRCAIAPAPATLMGCGSTPMPISTRQETSPGQRPRHAAGRANAASRAFPACSGSPRRRPSIPGASICSACDRRCGERALDRARQGRASRTCAPSTRSGSWPRCAACSNSAADRGRPPPREPRHRLTSDPPWRPPWARRCPAGRPSARRISSWRCSTIAPWCAPLDVVS